MKRLNHCRDSGASGFGGTMGGSRRHRNNHATCPTCHKRVQITSQGRLRAHGTYTQAPWGSVFPDEPTPVWCPTCGCNAAGPCRCARGCDRHPGSGAS